MGNLLVFIVLARVDTGLLLNFSPLSAPLATCVSKFGDFDFGNTCSLVYFAPAPPFGHVWKSQRHNNGGLGSIAI